jgi:hypothetical protein
MKTYEVYVKIGAIDHFCNQLRLYGGIIKSTKIVFSKQGKVTYRNFSLTRQRLKAIEDGIITRDESELLRQYIVINNGG